MTKGQPIKIDFPVLITGDLPAEGKSIVTHDGRFHADDALAVGLLLLLPEFKNATVVRTRNEDIMKRATIVVDVGGVYDEEALRFDHHQKGFAGFFDSEWHTVTKMSSAGMVFKRYGRRILMEVFKIPESHVDVAIKKIYESFVESVDAIDNGVNICPKGVEPLYMVRSDYCSRVARLNEDWNEWTGDCISAVDFRKAIDIAIDEFSAHCFFCRDSWLPARIIVENGFKNRFEVHNSGQIIELETGCPFEDHLEMLEKEFETAEAQPATAAEAQPATAAEAQPATETAEICNGQQPKGQQICLPKGILFVMYPNDDTKKSWRLKAVKAFKMAFGNRLDLPERVAGLKADQIEEKLGFKGVSFVHHAKFLAGCDSREAALRLFDLTLNERVNAI